MPGEMKKDNQALGFLKNNKGQNIVEFALLLAFCAGIGLAAREAGLLDALNESYSQQQAVYEPVAIVKNETARSGDIAAVEDTGGGSNAVNQSQASQNQNNNANSSEASAFDALNELKKNYTDLTDEVKEAIWNAYKGEKTYDNAAQETKAKHATLALLGADNVTDVSDENWLAIKEDQAWAFDDADKYIYKFLLDNASLTANELKIRNTYFASLSEETINKMKTNRSNSAFDSENAEDIPAIYQGYLAIKKQFWVTDEQGNVTIKPVTLSLAPLITDTAFNATSDERKVYNYLNGDKGLKDYFDDFVTGDDLTNKVKAAFNLNGDYTINDTNLNAMLTKENVSDLADEFKKEVDSGNNLNLDTDETTIHDFLSGKDVNDVQARNKYFADMDTTVIGKMKDAADRSDGSYDGYLAMKKQFGFETIPAETLNNFAPLISTDGSISDEKKVFDFIKGLKNYFNGLNDSEAKVWRAFGLNGQYNVDGVEAASLAAMISKVDGNLADAATDEDFAFWKRIKESHGWEWDADDNTIKNRLNVFIGQIKIDLEKQEMTDAQFIEQHIDEIVEELVERNAQFKNFGNSDANKLTIKKMITNLSSGQLNEDAYKGYLAIKKQFWQNNNQPVQLDDLVPKQGSSGGDLTPKPDNVKGLPLSVVEITSTNWNTQNIQNLIQRGSVYKNGTDYYVYFGWSNQCSSLDDLRQPYNSVKIDDIYYEKNYNTGDLLPSINGGDILVRGNEAYVYTNNYYVNSGYTCPVNLNDTGTWLKLDIQGLIE